MDYDSHFLWKWVFGLDILNRYIKASEDKQRSKAYFVFRVLLFFFFSFSLLFPILVKSFENTDGYFELEIYLADLWSYHLNVTFIEISGFQGSCLMRYHGQSIEPKSRCRFESQVLHVTETYTSFFLWRLHFFIGRNHYSDCLTK